MSIATNASGAGTPAGPGLREGPLFSVVICTRNRAASVATAARSVLAVRHASLELLVMDQSDDGATRLALAPLLTGEKEDARLRVISLDRPGKSNALNAARRQARGQFLALTDDDCECAPDWLEAVKGAFTRDPDLGCVFGEVLAGPHDPADSYVPVNHISAPLTLRTVREWLRMPGPRHFGIGANMTVRADALEAVGGWDPCVGPGAEFGSGDDHDLAVRMLQRGYGVHLCPQARVVHHGARRRRGGAADMERVGRGFGAAFAKHLRCGVVYHGSLRMLAFFLRRAFARLFRPEKGFAFLRGWARGFRQGLFHGLAREKCLYIETASEPGRRKGDEAPPR